MSINSSLQYIEVLKTNTVESIRLSLEYMKAERLKKQFLASEVPVIERLLLRFDELSGFWKHLVSDFNYQARYDLIECIVGLIVTANPDRFVNARRIQKELEDNNREIAKTAAHLSNLMQRHVDIKEGSGVSSDNFRSIRYAINYAAERSANHHYESYPQSELNRLFNQYDDRYWPSLPEIIDAIGANAEYAEIYVVDEVTEVGTQSQRASSVDCVNAFYELVQLATQNDAAMLKKVFSLPNGEIATLLNIVYDWKDEKTLSTEQLKNYKSRYKKNMDVR